MKCITGISYDCYYNDDNMFISDTIEEILTWNCPECDQVLFMGLENESNVKEFLEA